MNILNGVTAPKLGIAFGTAAMMMLSASTALAAGTTAGTVITNNVSVDYQVGGVQQTAATSSASVTVDRKVNLTVTETNSAAVIVAPRQQRVATTFWVDNLSNDVLDFGLAATQLSSATAAHGGTDNFDVTGVTIHRDSNSNGTYDDGTDAQITYIDELAADGRFVVFVVGNVPDGRATNDIATVLLTATAASGGTANSQGSNLVQTTGANTSGVDTVFADGAGSGEAANNGQHAAIDDFKVLTAALTAVKSSTVISDPVNGTTNPKNIPGAIVEFCVAITNAAGGTTASGLTVSAQVAAGLTYVPNSIRLNGTVSSGVCQADGTAGGSFSGSTVSGTLTDLAAGNTRTLVYRAEVQ